MGVSAQTLAMIRRAGESWLNDTCMIQRESLSVGLMGEPTHAWEIVAVAAPCRVIFASRQNSGDDSIRAGAEQLEELYRIALLRTQDVGMDYRITVGGKSYDVIRIEAAQTDKAFTMAVVSTRNQHD